MIIELCDNGYITYRSIGASNKMIHKTLDEVMNYLLQAFEGRAEAFRGESHGRVIIIRGWHEEGIIKGCGVCGSGLVMIRGRYPHQDHREVCPTCAVERLENIKEIATGNLTGQAQCEKGEG